MPAKAKLRSLIVKHPVVPHPEAILNTQYLEVPIDRHLEARAHRLIAMKDHKARLKGVMILRHFKSDGNVKLLKALLASDAAAHKIESPSRDAVLEHRTWRVY